MSDLATAKDHLAEAQSDLVEGEASIRQQAALIEHMRGAGQDVAEEERLLRILVETPDAWAGHRDMIRTTIARLEADREWPGEL